MASSSPRRSPLLFVASVVIFALNLIVVDGFQSGLKLPLSRARRGSLRSRSRPWANLTLSVAQFGARGDGYSDDTEAFIKAWKYACSSRAMVTIEVPAENVYLIRPIQLSGPCKSKLTMLVSGTIVAPSDPDVWDGLDPHKWLYFHGVKDFVVTGGGTINGMGQEWWARSCKRNATKPCHKHAPTAVTFHRINRLMVHDLRLINSQQMHMTFSTCSQVKASRLQVIAPARSPNTDGIHISDSNSVIIEESMIKTGDDCVSIVGNSSNILVRNIICGPGHGISIGSLGKSKLTAKVENVEVDGAYISNTENGVRIKTWQVIYWQSINIELEKKCKHIYPSLLAAPAWNQGGNGYAHNIIFRNVVMSNVSNPIIIDQYYCDSKRPCQNQTSAVQVYDVAFVGIKGTSATEHAVKFACSDTFPCEDIYLKDIRLLLDSGEDATAFCWKASGFSSGEVYPPSCLSSPDTLIKQTIAADTTLHSMYR